MSPRSISRLSTCIDQSRADASVVVAGLVAAGPADDADDALSHGRVAGEPVVAAAAKTAVFAASSPRTASVSARPPSASAHAAATIVHRHRRDSSRWYCAIMVILLRNP